MQYVLNTFFIIFAVFHPFAESLQCQSCNVNRNVSGCDTPYEGRSPCPKDEAGITWSCFWTNVTYGKDTGEYITTERGCINSSDLAAATAKKVKDASGCWIVFEGLVKLGMKEEMPIQTKFCSCGTDFCNADNSGAYPKLATQPLILFILFTIFLFILH